MTENAALRIIVCGKVQGVFFRQFVTDRARELNLTGYVRNSSDRTKLEINAEGNRDKLSSLLEMVKAGPPAAQVEQCRDEWFEFTGSFKSFRVLL